MFEYIMLAAIVVIMYRLAEFQKSSGLVWGGITFVLCFLSLVIPLPFLRLFFAGVLSFIALIAVNLLGEKGKKRS